MITASGKQFTMDNVNPENFHIRDIALGLAGECRWAGQLAQHYSVAQHSVLVASVLQERHGKAAALVGLLHDCSEAYLKDIPTDVKALLPDYQKLEQEVQDAIFRKYVGHVPLESLYKEVDLIVAAAEYQDLHPARETILPEQLDIERSEVGYIIPWNYPTSVQRFLSTFQYLKETE